MPFRQGRNIFSPWESLRIPGKSNDNFSPRVKLSKFIDIVEAELRQGGGYVWNDTQYGCGADARLRFLARQLGRLYKQARAG
jgi:hypothetical protein